MFQQPVLINSVCNDYMTINGYRQSVISLAVWFGLDAGCWLVFPKGQSLVSARTFEIRCSAAQLDLWTLFRLSDNSTVLIIFKRLSSSGGQRHVSIATNISYSSVWSWTNSDSSSVMQSNSIMNINELIYFCVCWLLLYELLCIEQADALGRAPHTVSRSCWWMNPDWS